MPFDTPFDTRKALLRTLRKVGGGNSYPKLGALLMIDALKS